MHLEAIDLRKRFGDQTVVAGVSLSVDGGEVLGLLGPNGAGKTTTMMMLCGLLASDSGEVRIDGKRFDPSQPELRRCLGVAPQELAIYPELTARENVAFFGRLYGLTGGALNTRVADVLDRVGLTAAADRECRPFSGGMKRRLNFAVALVHQPQLLILDEPTVGVDPQSRSHMLELVKSLAGEGVACVYASHYMDEVEAVCDRVAIMDQGRILDCDRIPALLAQLPSELRIHLAESAAKSTTESTGSAADSTIRVPVPIGEGFESQLAATLEQIHASGRRAARIETITPSLERLFLERTGRTLRD